VEENHALTSICNMAGTSHTGISTFVFVDTESTGLPATVDRPRVVEIAFIAVKRKHFLLSSTEQPARVLNKLLLAINPGEPMPSRASRINGFIDGCLDEENLFTAKTAKLLNQFLENLAKPICLIAHKAEFHLSLLLAEMNSVSQTFPRDLLYADSLDIFRKNLNSALEDPVESFKLKDIYYEIFSETIQPKSNLAEADCMALFKISQFLGEYFSNWIDKDVSSLKTLAPMW